VSERDQKTLLTGCEADDPNVEEVEVGDPRLGLVDLVQPAPGAPLAVLLPPRQQWRRRADVLAAGHLLITLSLCACRALAVLRIERAAAGERRRSCKDEPPPLSRKRSR
jgi:hypothetical protein